MKKIVKPTQRRRVMETRFARLLESELEATSLVLNARAIADKLQKMAEDLAKIEPDDVMPLLSAFRDAFGPEVTDQFHKTTIATIRKMIDTISQGQLAIGNEVTRLEKTAAGEDTSDMATDSAGMDDDGGDMGADADLGNEGSDMAADSDAMAGDAGAAPGDEDNMADMDDGGHPGDDSDAMVGGNSAGRGMKKESASVRRFGRHLREFASAHQSDNIEALRAMEPKAATLASQISQTISRAHLDDSIKRELSHALSHLCGAASNSAHFEDPDQKVETTLAHAHLDSRLPEVRTVTSMLKKLAHLIAFKHEGMLDSPISTGNMMETVARNVRRLRESANPDGLVLSSFRKRLREGAPAFEAAARTARSYAIDVADVASIVKEAKASARPFAGKARRVAESGRDKIGRDDINASQSARWVQKNLGDKGIHCDLIGRTLVFADQGEMDRARKAVTASGEAMPQMRLKQVAAARKESAGVRGKAIAEADDYAPMFPVGAGGPKKPQANAQGNAQGKFQAQANGKEQPKSGKRRVEVDEDEEGAPGTTDGTSDQPAAPSTSGTPSNAGTPPAPGSNTTSASATGATPPRPPNAPQNSGTQAAPAGQTPPNAPQPAQGAPAAPSPAYAPKGTQQAPGAAGQPGQPGMDGEQQDSVPLKPGTRMPGKVLNRAPNAPR